MKNRLIVINCALLIFLINACVSVPPQVVTSQELIGSGLQTSRENQIALIEAWASDQKQQKKDLLENVVIDIAIQRKLNGRSALPPDEVKSLIIEFHNDALNEYESIDTKKAELIRIANENFNEMEKLNRLNLNYMKSLLKVSQQQEELLGEYNEIFKQTQKKFLEQLGIDSEQSSE